jgi:hypothetical protein
MKLFRHGGKLKSRWQSNTCEGNNAASAPGSVFSGGKHTAPPALKNEHDFHGNLQKANNAQAFFRNF